MKSIPELREELIRIGATQRLLELNQERDALLKFLNRKSSKSEKILTHVRKKYKRNGKHWTQKPENKEKLMRMIKANAAKAAKKRA